MSFGEKILKYREPILKDLAALVAVESVNGKALEGMPFGEKSAEALNLILGMAERMGFRTKNVGNYAGHAEYGEGEEVAATVSHVDVVPAGTGWDTDPFVLTKKGNLYFGRGAADDKGASIAALYCLKVLQDEKVAGKRRLRTIFGAGEETGSNDLEMYFRSEQMPVMAFTPDSEYGICNREKGILRLKILAGPESTPALRSFSAGTVVNAVPARAEAEVLCSGDSFDALKKAADEMAGGFELERTAEGVKLVSAGKASHAMQPQEGVNAASRLIELLFRAFRPEELGTLLSFLKKNVGMGYDGDAMGVKREDAESGPLTLNLGLVHIAPEGSYAGIDIRYPVTSDGDEILAEISRRAEAAGLRVADTADTKPLFLPDGSPLISLLKDAYASVTGKSAGVYATGGGTYARALKGNGVAFGPIFPDEPDRRLHNTNENIDIDRFMAHAQICLEAMYRMFTA